MKSYVPQGAESSNLSLSVSKVCYNLHMNFEDKSGGVFDESGLDREIEEWKNSDTTASLRENENLSTRDFEDYFLSNIWSRFVRVRAWASDSEEREYIFGKHGEKVMQLYDDCIAAIKKSGLSLEDFTVKSDKFTDSQLEIAKKVYIALRNKGYTRRDIIT